MTATMPTLDYARVRVGSYSRILRYVRQHNGTPADADDLCQDAMLVLTQRLQEPTFELEVPAEAYVFAVARNLWRKHLRDTQPYSTLSGTEGDAPDLADPGPDPAKVHGWLARITVHCQRLIHIIYFLGRKPDEVAQEFRYRNRSTTYNQRYKCLQQLRKASTEQP